MSDEEQSRRNSADETSSADEVPFSITPEQYAEFIEQIELRDDWLDDARISNQHGPFTPDQATVRFESEAHRDTLEEGFLAFHQHHVLFETPEKTLAEIEVTFGLAFSSKTPMTEDTFMIFSEANPPVNTWPYLREFVSTTLGRMGWQPFTPPAFKTNVVRPRRSPGSATRRRGGSKRTSTSRTSRAS